MNTFIVIFSNFSAADISLNSEAMPDLMLTLTESPEVSVIKPTKLNLSNVEDSPVDALNSAVTQK